MLVTRSPMAGPFLQGLPERPSVIDVARENRQHERAQALASIPTFNVTFNFEVGSNSIIVTLSDRTSGEIFRKLVYDQSGALQPQALAASGQRIDVMV